MRRSAGVTISAVVVILGSALTILFGAAMMVSFLALPRIGHAANLPAFVGYFVAIEAVMFLGFGGWGIASGIGLINLRQWARISVLVFAVILVGISFPAAVVMSFIPLPKTTAPNLPSDFSAIMHAGMAAFYAMFAALGGLWLYFFNKQSVKSQFHAGQPDIGSATSGLAVPPATADEIRRQARPLSITIIGWFMLVGSALAPPFLLLLNKGFFTFGTKLPLYLLGMYFFGRSAYVIVVVLMGVQLAAAVGLLRLKSWGLFTTIGLQCLTVVNATMLVAIPGSRRRFQQIMEGTVAAMNAHTPQQVSFVPPVWIGLLSSIPIVFVILWFLITRRKAFTGGAEPRFVPR